MELSGPGVQYIADNQLYNSLITAHAILMSTPLCYTCGMLPRAVATGSRLKGYQAGSVELYGETQTAKLIVTGIDGARPNALGPISYLNCSTFRLTNLTRIIHHNGIPNTFGFRLGALYTSILSLVSTLLKSGNGITHRESKQCAGNQLQSTPVWNYGITYGTGPVA